MTKRLINNPVDFVEEMLQGLTLCHPTVTRLQDVNVIVRSDYQIVKEKQVAIISGGGSGHEPAHAGYVGHGMLSAAVPGGVFASPSVSQILAAIRTVTGTPGCLLIIKNYTGDRLNFGLACEQARAEGFKLRMVVVGDDCAIKETGIAGRRGLAGTVFVHKVAGAAAAAGCSLDEVTAEAQHAADSIGTMGIALSVCTLPGQTTSDRLGPNDMEFGLGIHGEPGVLKCPLQPADQCVDKMLTTIYKPEEEGGSGYLPLSSGDAVCLLVSNLGSTPISELYIVARRAIQQLEADGISVVRVVVGTFMPALDMNGVSITLLRASAQGSELMLERLDSPTSAAWWPIQTSVPRKCPSPVPPSVYSVPEQSSVQYATVTSQLAGTLKAVVVAVCQELITAEPKLTQWDSVVGDGDCGETFRRGAEAVIKGCDAEFSFDKPARLLLQIADTLRDSMGGTSGVLLDIMMRTASAELNSHVTGAGLATIPASDWLAALKTGVDRMQLYGGGRVGMRTMLDAIVPALEASQKAVEDGASPSDLVNQAAKAAVEGAEKTKTMDAKAGRSSYVGKEHLSQVPDPGAMAIAFALEAVAKTLAS